MVDEYFENVASHIILVFESCAGKNLLDVNRDTTTRPDDPFILQKRFTVSEEGELASYFKCAVRKMNLSDRHRIIVRRREWQPYYD